MLELIYSVTCLVFEGNRVWNRFGALVHSHSVWEVDVWHDGQFGVCVVNQPVSWQLLGWGGTHLFYLFFILKFWMHDKNKIWLFTTNSGIALYSLTSMISQLQLSKIPNSHLKTYTFSCMSMFKWILWCGLFLSSWLELVKSQKKMHKAN